MDKTNNIIYKQQLCEQERDMIIKERNYENILKKIKARYFFAIGLILLLLTIGQIIVQLELRQDKIQIDSTNMAENQELINQKNNEDIFIIETLEKTELGIYLIIVIVIIFETILIFLPTKKVLSLTFKEIYERNESILNIFKIIHGAIFLVDNDNFNVLFMNDAANPFITNLEVGVKKGNFIEDINWKSISKNLLKEIIEREEKISDMEIEVTLPNEDVMVVLLSTVREFYQGKEVIVITLFDITLRKREEENMLRMATKDELTGLYNRHYMDKIISDTMERGIRYNFPVSVLIIDLDFFKRINDTWGHPVGDTILQHTARISSENIRKFDTFFRLGGEEFLLLMPHTNIKEGIALGERIRREIEKYEDPIVGKFTASVGVAQSYGNESFDDLYKRVDSALYRAKNEGRNRVVGVGDIEEDKGILFEWKKEWNSGDEENDKQHQKILTIANEIVTIMTLKKDMKREVEEIDQLFKHIQHHFEYEEELLKKVGYPDYIAHIGYHEELATKLAELKLKYEEGELKFSAFFAFIVEEIILGHLLEKDTLFFPYTKEKE